MHLAVRSLPIVPISHLAACYRRAGLFVNVRWAGMAVLNGTIYAMNIRS